MAFRNTLLGKPIAPFDTCLGIYLKSSLNFLFPFILKASVRTIHLLDLMVLMQSTSGCLDVS